MGSRIWEIDWYQKNDLDLCLEVVSRSWYWALIKAYWDHDLDLSGSRDIIGHVTIRFPDTKCIVQTDRRQTSIQTLRYIRRWISRKPLEIEAWFQRTTNRKWHWLSRDWWRHVTPKVLWGCTVGYPSDSLASCLVRRTV